jgi:hypothetical protein
VCLGVCVVFMVCVCIVVVEATRIHTHPHPHPSNEHQFCHGVLWPLFHCINTNFFNEGLLESFMEQYEAYAHANQCYLEVRCFVCACFFLWMCLPVRLSFYQSINLSVCLSVCLSNQCYLEVRWSVCVLASSYGCGCVCPSLSDMMKQQ